MILQEFRDIFIAEYIYEAQKRREPRIELPNKLIASWIAEAQQSINLRVKPIKTYQDVTIVAGLTDYSLNSNYGKAIGGKLGDANGVIGDVDVILVDTTDLLTTDTSGAKIAIYWDPTDSIHKLRVAPAPTENFTIRLWYYADTLWYSPSGATSQDYGSFDGDSFTGNLKIPDKYQMLVKYYLLGKCFNDYSEYEKQLSILRVNSGDTKDNRVQYKWNDP